jgi:hypothetical protein
VRRRGAESDFFASAILLALAVLAKLSGVFWLAPALAWAREHGAPPRRLALYAAVVLFPAAAAFAAGGGDRLAGLWSHTAGTPYAGLGTAQNARAFLAFIGGCVLPAGLWPLLGAKGERDHLFAGAAAAAILFLPWFDADSVRFVDRLTGFVFACGALLVLREAARRRAGGDGRIIWQPWIVAAGVLQLFVYWSVVARYILFLVPPLTFAAARGLEVRLSDRRRRRVYRFSLASAAAVSLALSYVDFSYADAQRYAASAVSAAARAPGARLWFTGHWGLQEYMERAGALALDRGRGGWSEVAAGDRVLVPTVNALTIRPDVGVHARTSSAAVDCGVPLRLISGWGGEGGFYSSASGFLPYSLSLEPIDRFAFVEKL